MRVLPFGYNSSYSSSSKEQLAADIAHTTAVSSFLLPSHPSLF